MKLCALKLVVLVSFLGLLTTLAQAAPKSGATETVRRVNASISKTLSSKKSKSKPDETRLLQQARAKLGAFLNIEDLGKRAMQDHWSTLSAEEQTEFLALLRNLIETNYVLGLRSNLSYEVSYMGEAPVGKHVRVQTLVTSQRKGRPLKIEIDYLLSKSAEGWSTFDITTDGVGLVENYRSMFNIIIAKSGPEELLKRMRTKLAALSK